MGMRVEAYFYLLITLLFGLTGLGYWYFSRDPTGTTALAITTMFAFLVGFYLYFTGQRIGRRAEDDAEGEISEGAGQYGFYSPHSWWPLWLGLASAVTGFGVAIAWWLALTGCALIAMATVGFVFEYYRGLHYH
ncbi:MAG: cytochrome c oxidase subunit 4 [Streptosporangiaceae bacterium]